MQRFVVNTLFQKVTDHHNRKDGSKEAQKLDPCWKSRPVACMVNTELKLPMKERNWIDIEPGNYSLSAYESIFFDILR